MVDILYQCPIFIHCIQVGLRCFIWDNFKCRRCLVGRRCLSLVVLALPLQFLFTFLWLIKTIWNLCLFSAAGVPCPLLGCDGKLELRSCHGLAGNPVTHFWRTEGSTVYFQAKGVHDHPAPEVYQRRSTTARHAAVSNANNISNNDNKYYYDICSVAIYGVKPYARVHSGPLGGRQPIWTWLGLPDYHTQCRWGVLRP